MGNEHYKTIPEAIANGDKIEVKLYNGLNISLDLKNESHKAMFESFINRFPRERCSLTQVISVMLPLYAFVTLEKGDSGNFWKSLTLEQLLSERALEDAAREVVMTAVKTDFGKELATLYCNNIFNESYQDGNPYMIAGSRGDNCWVKVDWQQIKKELKKRYDIDVYRPIQSRRIPVLEGFYRVVHAVNLALFDKFLTSIMPKEKESYSISEVTTLISQINQKFNIDVKDWQIVNRTHSFINAIVLRDKLLKDVGEVILGNRC